MSIAPLLKRLETEQAKLAAAALGQPAGRDAFEYGRVSGMWAGLELAKQSLIDFHKEIEGRE